MKKLYFKDIINLFLAIVIIYAMEPILKFLLYQDIILFPELYYKKIVFSNNKNS